MLWYNMDIKAMYMPSSVQFKQYMKEGISGIYKEKKVNYGKLQKTYII